METIWNISIIKSGNACTDILRIIKWIKRRSGIRLKCTQKNPTWKMFMAQMAPDCIFYTKTKAKISFLVSMWTMTVSMSLLQTKDRTCSRKRFIGSISRRCRFMGQV